MSDEAIVNEPIAVKRTAGRPRKNFKPNVGALIQDQGGNDANNFADLDTLLGRIQIGEGENDIVSDGLDTISDRSVNPAELEPDVAISSPEKEPLVKHRYHDLGDDIEVNPILRRRMNELKESGKPLDEIERIAGFEGLNNPAPAAANIMDNLGNIPAENNPLLEQPPRQPLSSDQIETNAISAEELINLYDTLQAGGSIWAYNHFSSPENALVIAEKLQGKVMSNTASEKERELFATANARVIDFQKRKESFASQAQMSQNSKAQASRVLAKIMQVRGYDFPPEALLLLILLTPLVINGGKIFFERAGFKDGDEMLAQFTNFVDKKNNEFDKKN